MVHDLTSLVELRVEDCTRCRKLPALGQLPFLKRLYLTGLENIRSIGLSFYSTSAEEDGGSGGSSTISRQTFFPALKILSLESMKNLEEWKDAPEMMSTAGEVHVMDAFPVLEKLSISDCPQLTTIPTPSRFPSLDVLEIKKNCHVLLAEKVLSNIATLSSLELIGGSYQHIESLKLVKRPESSLSLSIDGCNSLPTDMLERLYLFPTLQRVDLMSLTVAGCDALTRLPVEMFESCTSLRELKLFDCRSLVSFPLDLRQTPSLESFTLLRCPKLIAEMPSGFGFLTSLRKVVIGPFSDCSVIEFDWAGLASSSTLQHVYLCGMPDTKSLPHQLQSLTTITSLSLVWFGAIEALPDWLGNLASLEDLILLDCKKLEYLPSVDAMERLKLRHLQILFCPLLERRCTPESGSEWPKISNIPESDIIVPATSVSEAASSDSAETL